MSAAGRVRPEGVASAAVVSGDGRVWAIANSTDFPAVGSWVQDRDANKIWLVCVKATFDVEPDGRVRPAVEQSPPLLQGVPVEGDFSKSLIYESDFFGTRPDAGLFNCRARGRVQERMLREKAAF